MFAILVLIIESAILALFKLICGEDESNVLQILFIILFSLAFIITVRRSKQMSEYKAPVTLGYLLRAALLFFDVYGREFYILPGSGGDSEGFYHSTVTISQGGIASYGAVFAQLFGFIGRLIGTSRLFLQFLILLSSIVAILFAIKTIECVITDNRVKRYAISLLCLLPNYAILSSIFLREALISAILSISFFYFARWFFEGTELHFGLAFALTFCAAAFHSGVVGVAVGYIVVRMLFDKRTREFKFSANSIIAAIFFALVFAFAYTNYGDKFFSYFGGIESVEDVASGEGLGGSTYAQYVGDSRNVFRMIIFTIPRIIYFLFSPFPWQWRGLSDIIAFCFSSMFFLWTAISVIKYLKGKYLENRNIVIALSLVAACTVFMYAWGVSNTGTAIRHRDKPIVLYAILWCCTYQKKRRINT